MTHVQGRMKLAVDLRRRKRTAVRRNRNRSHRALQIIATIAQEIPGPPNRGAFSKASLVAFPVLHTHTIPAADLLLHAGVVRGRQGLPRHSLNSDRRRIDVRALIHLTQIVLRLPRGQIQATTTEAGMDICPVGGKTNWIDDNPPIFRYFGDHEAEEMLLLRPRHVYSGAEIFC